MNWRGEPDSRFNWFPHSQNSLTHVLIADLHAAVAPIQKLLSFEAPSTTVSGEHLRRIRGLLSGPMLYSSCFFSSSSLLSARPALALLGNGNYLSSLRLLFCEDELKSILDSEAPGLRCRAFYIATVVAHVTVDEKGVLGMCLLFLRYTVSAS